MRSLIIFWVGIAIGFFIGKADVVRRLSNGIKKLSPEERDAAKATFKKLNQNLNA